MTAPHASPAMTYAQLIEKLKECDPDAPAEIAIRCYTKAYPAAYVQPWVSNGRITCSLPDNMHTVTRKSA